MKYAIISDIQGNNHAFKAVLADAEANGVDKFLLLGDYTNNYSQGNDVVNAIRKLSSAVVIRGNGESDIISLRGVSVQQQTYEQLKPLYWVYRNLSQVNHKFLAKLPATAEVEDSGKTIYLEHFMSLFNRTPVIELFDSRHYRLLMTNESFSHEDYLLFARAIFLSCPGVLDEIVPMPEGVYLFGHNHLQFHMEYEGRLFINPGSCGDPLNWDTRAAYTILSLDDFGWKVDERRVEYDLKLVDKELDISGYTEYAPMWSKLIKMQVKSAKDYYRPFMAHLIETGLKRVEYTQPLSNDVWEEAVATWDPDKVLDSRAKI